MSQVVSPFVVQLRGIKSAPSVVSPNAKSGAAKSKAKAKAAPKRASTKAKSDGMSPKARVAKPANPDS